MSYALVQNGVVQTVLVNLPSSYNGISGFDQLPVDQLAAAGWLPITGDPPTFDPDAQALSEPAYTIGTTSVSASYTVNTLTTDQIAANLATAQSEKVEELANARYNASLFFTYGQTAQVACDDTSQSRLTSAVVGIQAAQGYEAAAAQAAGQPAPAPLTISWNITPGVFETWGLTDLEQFGIAMMQHVQGCWSNQASLAAQIAAATKPSDLAAIDITKGWPT